MAEPMREIMDAAELEGVAKLHPGVRKVTVDMPGRVAYVFVGQGNRALTVTGEAFDQLVKVVPSKDGAGEDVADENVTEGSPAPGKTAAKGKGK